MKNKQTDLLRKIVRRIRRAWYKIPVYESQWRDVAFGRFRVLYKDGQESHPMCWKNSKTYADLFGGKVIDNF